MRHDEGMPIAQVLPVPSESDVDVARNRLADAEIVLGSGVNSAGIHLGKTVPVDRLGAFAISGLGASPSWHVFCIDGDIAFTPSSGVVGDMRMRIDLDAARSIGGGIAWGPTEFLDQHGTPVAASSRGALRRVQHELESAGFDALVGHELEFVLTGADGEAFPRRGWTPYGVGPLLDHEGFVAELTAAAASAGIPLEQLHAEYAVGQFEFSLPPATPLQAADDAVLARILVARIARAHGLAVSFSPVPFAGGGGNGAHQHFSLVSDGAPLLSGSDGPHGMTAAGASAIAGVLDALPGMQAVLAGSILSSARLQPGFWAGAWRCWGTENREAAVRFVEATPANPRGANVEVKIADPSANPYLVTAAILGAALDGIRSSRALPDEVTVNPADLDAAARERTGTVELSAEVSAALDALESSKLMRSVLGEAIIESVLAVRRHEQDAYGDTPIAEVTERFRFAWTS